MESNFPWKHRRIPFRGEKFDMSFLISDVFIKFVSDFEGMPL